MGNVIKKIIGGREYEMHTTYDGELNVMHDFLSRCVEKNKPYEEYRTSCRTEAATELENLIIIDRGTMGLSFHKFSKCSECGKLIGDKWIHIIEWEHDYVGISGDDILDYDANDLTEACTDRGWTEAEKKFLHDAIIRQSYKAKHRDYYDADDNTWKDYD